jgi:hypothetical protein
MMFKRSGDRTAPPAVPDVVRDGVRYAQAGDGRQLGYTQMCGVLLATTEASGAQLWTLPVYGNEIDASLEADVQWVYFRSMAFDADGQLRIENERGKVFLVDVETRTVKPVAP